MVNNQDLPAAPRSGDCLPRLFDLRLRSKQESPASHFILTHAVNDFRPCGTHLPLLQGFVVRLCRLAGFDEGLVEEIGAKATNSNTKQRVDFEAVTELGQSCTGRPSSPACTSQDAQSTDRACACVSIQTRKTHELRIAMRKYL